MEEEFLPHPSWDYYLSWHAVIRVQAMLEKAKTAIRYTKSPDTTASEDFSNYVNLAIETLEKSLTLR